jgi:hypothetical protein
MKRTWITVKRGILEPKHRFALGELIWLFIYILDRTNWEAGVIEEWLDRAASEEMEMPIETLRDQRRKLEAKGYITCERKQRGIRILVHNWTNPKEYTGKVYNQKIMSDTPSFTPDCTPSFTPDFNDPSHENVSSYSQKTKVTNHKPFNNLFVGEFLRISEIPGINSDYQGKKLCELRDQYSESKVLEFAEWCKGKIFTIEDAFKSAKTALPNWKSLVKTEPVKPKKIYYDPEGNEVLR